MNGKTAEHAEYFRRVIVACDEEHLQGIPRKEKMEALACAMATLVSYESMQLFLERLAFFSVALQKIREESGEGLSGEAQQ